MATVYVSNISFKVNQEQFQKEFEQYGKVKSAKIITYRGYSKGYGFVEFDNAADAEKAVKADGKEFDGRKLKINIAKPKEERKAPVEKKEQKPAYKPRRKNGPRRIFKNTRRPTGSSRRFPRRYPNRRISRRMQKREKAEATIYVKNLKYDITEEKLKQAFDAYNVKSVTIAKFTSKKDGQEKSRGFGFVEVKTAEDMKKAIDAMKGKDIEGRRVYVYQANVKPVPKEKAEATLYVKNLKYDITEEKLKEAFKAYNVKTATIVKFTSKKDGKERSKGFGFIEVASAEDMNKAIKEMNGKDIEGRKTFVYQANKKVEKPAEEKKN